MTRLPARPDVDDGQPLACWIANADATLHRLRTASGIVPVLVPDERPRIALDERAWVSCLWSAAVGYPLDEWMAHANPSPMLARAARIAARTAWHAGPWRGAVQVGSWPLSTTLRDPDGQQALLEAVDAAAECWPERAVAVRHVFTAETPALAAALAERGFASLPARVVYRLAPTPEAGARASHLRRDVSLLARSGLAPVPDAAFGDGDIDAALAMYRAVYRTRHSARNPDYTPAFIAWTRASGLLELVGLRGPDGRLVAFAARHATGGTTSVPMLGYDVAEDRSSGLYRQLVARLVTDAQARGQRFDFSSGAGDFKRKRGFEAVLERTMLRAPNRRPRRWPATLMLAIAQRATAGVDTERLIAAGA